MHAVMETRADDVTVTSSFTVTNSTSTHWPAEPYANNTVQVLSQDRCGPTGNSSRSENCLVADVRAVVDLLDFYLLPVIALVGTVGNLLSFLVFTTTYLHRLSSSVYLAALAVVDTVFLIVMLFNWMTVYDIQVYNMPGWCQLFAYWTYVSSFLSVWYVVCFSFERYLIIQFPLRRQVLCRPRRAKFVVIGFAVVGMLLYTFAIWTSTTVTYREKNRTRMYCQVKEDCFHLVSTINNVDTVVTLIVPSALIIFSNVRISTALYHFNRARQGLDEHHSTCSVPTPPSSVSTTGRSLHRKASSMEAIAGHPSSPPAVTSSTHKSPSLVGTANSSFNRLQLKITKMLLMVSIVFLLFNMPSHLVRVYFFVAVLVDPDYRPGDFSLIIQNITMYLFYANFATNFILYSASGRTFRRATYRLGRHFMSHVKKCYRCDCSCTCRCSICRNNYSMPKVTKHRQYPVNTRHQTQTIAVAAPVVQPIIQRRQSEEDLPGSNEKRQSHRKDRSSDFSSSVADRSKVVLRLKILRSSSEQRNGCGSTEMQ